MKTTLRPKDISRLKIAIAFLGLIIAIFAIGGARERHQFMASLGLARQPLNQVYFEFENATALNLASETLDAVRTVRDYNWLRHSDDLRHCWLMLPDTPTDAACQPPHTFQDGYYALTKDPSLSPPWRFSHIQGNILPSGDESTQTPPDNLFQDDQSRVLFIAESPSNPSTTITSPENGTKFFRVLEIQAKDNNTMNISAHVRWITEQGESHDITLATTLTNHKAL